MFHSAPHPLGNTCHWDTSHTPAPRGRSTNQGHKIHLVEGAIAELADKKHSGMRHEVKNRMKKKIITEENRK